MDEATPGRRPNRTAIAVIAAVGLAVALAGLVIGVAVTSSSAVDPGGGPIGGFGGKCVEVAGANTADGTGIQLYECNGTSSQRWTVQPDGTIRALGKCLDVSGASGANGARVQLWDCNGSKAQRWTIDPDGTVRALGKCLDAAGASSADRTPLQLWDCTGGANQIWTVGAAPTPSATGNPGPTTAPITAPDLGPNVSIFDPDLPAAAIQNRLNAVFRQQERNQFGSARFALLFKPGTYSVDANVGFYTQVAGLGLGPDAVTIKGAVRAEADWSDGNATQNFWRSAEGLSVVPTGGADRWAVSQGAPYRRMHLRGDLLLDDGGPAGGGLMADSKVDGQVRAGGQPQWLARNSQWAAWPGGDRAKTLNMVFVGSLNAPANSFPDPPHTTVGRTPVVREKPYLFVDGNGAFNVFVPAVRRDSAGISWAAGSPAGQSIPLGQFFIVKPGATAATINAALAAGRHLLVTPGVYHLNDTLRVVRPNTVVLGLGLATFVPDRGVTAMRVADVEGVKIAGLLFDAGTTNSPSLMEVGTVGSTADHSANPTSLHDVFFRVGGAGAGRATIGLRVNSGNVIGDHLWIWRADHGSGVGWGTNQAANGLVVNGANVTMYGLFVEHFQEYQTVWNGNGGRTYFYQNELPYDVPSQAGWRSPGNQGFAAYRVSPAVTSHEAWGLGSSCFFSTSPSIVLAHAFEAPAVPEVRFHSLVTASRNGKGTISHVINNTGPKAGGPTTVAPLPAFP